MSGTVFVTATPSQIPSATGGTLGHGDPCTLVILGATGDLAKRKLFPAIYELFKSNLLAKHFAVVGVDRVAQDDEAFRASVHDALSRSEEVKGFDPERFEALRERIHYVSGDLLAPEVYRLVGQKLATLEALESGPEANPGNRMFYLALPPSIFQPVVKALSESGLATRTHDADVRPWRRLIVEKPFGRSLATSQVLSELLLDRFGEHQIYRIDHYLGKETVQNILVFRTANLIFEPLWNNRYVSQVQITAAETVGVEKRGRYYEEAGVVRDMFQNHLFQLLALTAMELPVDMSANAVRDEKVKALKQVVPFGPDFDASAVRGQYTEGTIKGASVPGYREESDVDANSATPTYAALKVQVHNWRWQGVPFYLRSGKRMARRVSEIAITFREPPTIGLPGQSKVDANELVIRVQPNEGIHLRFQVKLPGVELQLTPEIEVSPVDMDFSYAEAFGQNTQAAYSTLLLDCMLGDATLFARTDEVEQAWRLVDPLLEYWDTHRPPSLPGYPAGSWGPHESDAFLARDGHRWRVPK